MSDLVPTPKKRNPLARTPLQALPPSARSRTAHGLTRAAAKGRFCLQQCSACNRFNYPPRDACPNCLSSDLPFVDAPRGGTLLSETRVRVPADVYFRERAPWRIGLVKLDCGPVVVAHLHSGCVDEERVLMSLQLDKAGQAAAFASPDNKTAAHSDDRQLREFTADSKYRRVLVTNGRSAVGQATVHALLQAGAKSVYVGISDAWKPCPGEEEWRDNPAIKAVSLDPGDERSVRNLAADIAGKTDILINTAEYIRPGGLLDRTAASSFHTEITETYMGMVHLARSFGPAMRSRGADGVDSAVAWVNVLSVYAMANRSDYGAYCAVQAACLSLSHSLRNELRGGGIRVMNVFSGPVDDEWFQTEPPPKVAPRAIAAAVVTGLKNGLEDVFVGDVAEDIRRRLAANPKAVERELP